MSPCVYLTQNISDLLVPSILFSSFHAFCVLPTSFLLLQEISDHFHILVLLQTCSFPEFINLCFLQWDVEKGITESAGWEETFKDLCQ